MFLTIWHISGYGGNKSCPKVVRKLPECCPKVARMLPKGCPEVARKLLESCPEVAWKLPRDTSTEMVTKIVPVRAVNMPIGAFCTEFRCERFCDNDVFGNRGRQKVALSQKRSHRNSVQNGPIERSTALTGTIFVTISVFMSQSPVSGPKSWPRSRKMSSSQSCSHRNSVQNGPVDKFTALTGTTFVTISVFMPRWPFSMATACKKNFGQPHMKKTFATACK